MSKKKKNGSVAPMFIALGVLMASLVFVIVAYLGGCSETAPTVNGSHLISEEEISSAPPQTQTQAETGEPASGEPSDEPVSSEPSEALSSELSSEPVSSNVSSKNNSSVSSHITSQNDEVPLWEVNNVTKGSNKFPYYIAVNREQNLVIVYSRDENGYYTVPHKAFVCSCGLPDPNDGIVYTPIGTFNTMQNYQWLSLQGGVYGQYATRIVGHILFHSVPYFKKAKDALEWEEYNKLGEAASLGCIRLCVADAKWIYDNCPIGTTVTIYDSDRVEPLDKPASIFIPEDSEYRDWDPTDPDENNPWTVLA